MNQLTIGNVAKQAGVKVETLRYYERRGILEEPHPDIGSTIRKLSGSFGLLRGRRTWGSRCGKLSSSSRLGVNSK